MECASLYCDSRDIKGRGWWQIKGGADDRSEVETDDRSEVGTDDSS